MAKPRTSNKVYSQLEQDYIRRVAGLVPALIIARQLKRSQSGIQQWAQQHGVKLRVPYRILLKHWPECIEHITKRSDGYGEQASMQK